MAEEPGADCLFLADGLAISEGSVSQGQDVVLYGPDIARGSSSPAADQDALLITENTAQTGPGNVLVNGQETGFFEGTESVSQFYDFTSGSTPNAQGLKDFGMDIEPSIPTLYIYIYRDTTNDVYSLGIWYYKDGSSSTSYNGITIEGSSEVFDDPGNPVVQDEPGDGGNNQYYTDSNGDANADHRIAGIENGDGAVWQLQPGSFTLTFNYRDHVDYGEQQPMEQAIFRGPKDNIKFDPISYGDSFEITFAL